MTSTQPAQVNALPPEILSSIFVSIVDASLYARSVGDDSYGSTEYPTLLSSVCTYWRCVSIGIPTLWSYIDLMHSNHHVRNIEHIMLWLERSQSVPLRVRVGKGGEEDELRETREWSWIFPNIVPQALNDELAFILTLVAPRLRSFTLKFSATSLATEALLAVLYEEGQHSIRELVIRQSRWLVTSRSQLLPEAEWNQLLVPLQVLHLERVDIEANSIPCRNLVELRLIHPTEFSLMRVLQILESNPGLHTIVLDGIVFDAYSLPTTLSINLPSLRYVQLSVDQGFMSSLFKLLVPGPHGLELDLGYIGPNAMNTMIPFFQRTYVKSLHIQTKGTSLLPILTVLPRLQRLRLTSLKFEFSTFAGLESATNLVPKLHTILLDGCDFDDYPTLCPGLRALLSLPSVRRIRHLNLRHRNETRAQETFIRLLEGGGFDASVIQASASDFEEYTSSLR